MSIRVVVLLGVVLGLAACESRINPFNWFGGPREERITVDENLAPLDPRGLVAQVVDLSIDPLPSGAIVTATGRPGRQGFWLAELIEVERADGRIVFEFRVAEPLGQTRQGTPRSREVIAAIDLSNQDLAQIREIVVQGAGNRLISRR